MSRRRKWAAGIASGVLLGVVVLLVAFDWNWVKGPVESAFTGIFGRNFQIHGDLEAEFALAPRIVMNDVTVDNADWGTAPHMLEAKRFAFVVDLWQLVFDGRVDVTDISLERPDVLVERSGDGEVNWQSAFEGGTEQKGPPRPPIIGAFSVEGGEITYRGPEAAREVRIALDQLNGRGGNASAPITVQATGSWLDQPLTLEAQAGSLIDFETGESPYPVEVALDVGETSIALTGSITEPTQFQAADLWLDLDSPDLAPLLAALDLSPPPELPTDISARLVHENQVWAIMDLDANLGAGRLAGRLGVDLAKEPLLVKADLDSSQLDVDRLLTVARALAPAGDASEQAPAQTDDTDDEQATADAEGRPAFEALLPDVRADIGFKGQDIAYRDLFFNRLTLDAALANQRPKVDLRGQGRIEDEPLDLELQVGRGNQGPEAKAPYLVRASLKAGATSAELSGTFPEPPTLAGFTGSFDIASPKPSTVLGIVGWPDPDMPPLELAGRVEHDGQAWRLSELSARVDQSDVEGRLVVDLGGDVPVIEADLSSQEIHVDDVRALMQPRVRDIAEEAREDVGGAPPESAETSPPLISDGEINPDALPQLRADVRWDVAQLHGPELRLEDVVFHGALRHDRVPAVALEAGGQFRGDPVQIDLALGAFEDQGAPDANYPIDATLEAGETSASLSGSLARPMLLEGLNLEVEASSSDLSKWLELAGLPAPEVPPVALSGQVVQDQQTWRLPEFYLEVGESNLFGEAGVDFAGKRPMITADLGSNRLLISDLADLAPEGEQEDEDGTASTSAAGINLEALPEVDFDGSLQAEYVLVEPVRFEQLSAEVHLRDRVLVLDLSGEGALRDGPLTLEAHLGSKESLRDPDARYPVQIELLSEDTELRASGTVGEPLAFTDLDVDVALKGPDLDRVGEILQLSLPETPPFDLQSHLAHEGDHWRFTDLDGTIGDSDIRGDVTLELGGERPMIRADLASGQLDFDDLGVLIGMPPATGPDETASEEQKREAAEREAVRGVLPNEPFDVPELRAVDAEVSFVSEQVEASVLPVQRMELELTLEDGLLALAPLRLGLADGELESEINLRAGEDVLSGEFDLVVRQIRMNQLLSHFDIDLPEIEMEEEGVGSFSGQAQLDIEGKSIQELAASADGTVVAAMDGGRINAMIVEGLGLDVGEILGLLLTDGDDQQDEMVPIHCFVSRFGVKQGLMKAEALVLDTSDSRITGSGQIDLGNESLDLRFVAHPKDASAPTASTPVLIEGSFENPEVDVVSEELREKALAALGLGVLLPVVGAIIPFIETGDGDTGSPCSALLNAVKETQDAKGPPGPDAQ